MPCESSSNKERFHVPEYPSALCDLRFIKLLKLHRYLYFIVLSKNIGYYHILEYLANICRVSAYTLLSMIDPFMTELYSSIHKYIAAQID